MEAMMTKMAFRTQEWPGKGTRSGPGERPRDDGVEQHRELEVDRLLAVGVELGRVAALGQPDDERAEDMPGKMKKTPSNALA